MADRAIEQAGARHREAARAALLAEADELGPKIKSAQADVDAFDCRTSELHEALVEHTGGHLEGIAAPIATPKGGPLRDQLQNLIRQQTALREQAERVSTPVVADLSLAQASLRLQEVSGEIDVASIANIEAVATDLLARANDLESEYGALVFPLREAWLELSPGRVISGYSIDQYVVHSWTPNVAEALLASYQRQLDAAVPGHLRIAGTRAPADPDRVAALEAEGARRRAPHWSPFRSRRGSWPRHEPGSRLKRIPSEPRSHRLGRWCQRDIRLSWGVVDYPDGMPVSLGRPSRPLTGGWLSDDRRGA